MLYLLLVMLCYGCSIILVRPVLFIFFCIFSLHFPLTSLAVSSDVLLSLSQVNGVNIDGLRHSEVVALIRAGGEEVRLLVVDQETDELFQRLGISPTTSHVQGLTVHSRLMHTHTHITLFTVCHFSWCVPSVIFP